MHKAKPILETCEQLHERFDYNPETGVLYNKQGQELVWKVSGRRVVEINHKRHFQSRIIWFMMTGEDAPVDMIVEHKDTNHTNNAWHNLRLATDGQNRHNVDYKGYWWHKASQRWQAQIGHEGKRIHIGYYDTEEEARQAYVTKREELRGEFAPGCAAD